MIKTDASTTPLHKTEVIVVTQEELEKLRNGEVLVLVEEDTTTYLKATR